MQDNGAGAILFGASAPDPNAAYLTLSLDDASVSKTLLPDVQGAVFGNLVLKGTRQGESQKTLGSWTTAAAMQSASVPLEVGIWTFNLSATSGGSSFSGTLQKEIVSGQNQLLFSLVLDDIGGGPGSFSLALSFDGAANAQNVSRVVASLENMDKTIVSGYEPKNLAVANNAVTFSGSQITAGTYRAKIKFYASVNGGDTEIASWSELVQIASGFDSSASRTIESFDELYTITYELNGGSFAAGTVVPETFTRKSAAITLPQGVTRDYYTFSGWHTDSNCSSESKITTMGNGDENVTLYAKWTAMVYKISYDIDGDGLVKSYTVEDDVNLADLSDDSVSFTGWCEDEACSGTVLAGWNAGEKHSDITLFAKCKIDFDATADDIVRKIKNMKKSGTISATGAFNSYKIRQINAALKELKSARPYVLVGLDLSAVTSLFGLEDAVTAKDSQLSLIVGRHNKYENGVDMEERDKTMKGYVVDGNSFFNCTNISEIVLPNNMTSIGCAAFWGCSSLVSVKFPVCLTSVGSLAFYGCKSLVNVELPTSVTSVAAGAFLGCSSLKNVALLGNVDVIDYCTFAFCSSLEKFEMPDEVTSVSYYAFYNCSSIESVKMSNALTSIGDFAFYNCSNLKDVDLPDGLKSIGGSAFYNCSLFTTVNFPSELTSIGVDAFGNCVLLRSVEFPAGMTSVGGFGGCTALLDVIIPSGVNIIGVRAFDGCSSLKNINFPSTLTEVCGMAFYNCISLKTIELPDSVEHIGLHAFTGCEIETFVMPKGLICLEGSAIGNEETKVSFEKTEKKWHEVEIGDSSNWTICLRVCNTKYVDNAATTHNRELIRNIISHPGMTPAWAYVTDKYLEEYWND